MYRKYFFPFDWPLSIACHLCCSLSSPSDFSLPLSVYFFFFSLQCLPRDVASFSRRIAASRGLTQLLSAWVVVILFVVACAPLVSSHFYALCCLIDLWLISEPIFWNVSVICWIYSKKTTRIPIKFNPQSNSMTSNDQGSRIDLSTIYFLSINLQLFMLNHRMLPSLTKILSPSVKIID